MRTGGNTFYLLNDHLTSTAITTNSSGVRQTELWRCEYDPVLGRFCAAPRRLKAQGALKPTPSCRLSLIRIALGQSHI